MIDQTPNLTQPVFPKKKKWYLKWWVIIIFIFFTLILVLITAFAFQVYATIEKIKKGDFDFTSVSGAESQLEQGSSLVNVSVDDDPGIGSISAKVKIIAFEDFECPASLESFPVVKEIISTYGNQIYFVYRDFPAIDIHPNAQKAHEAAACANDQGGFWPMHDKIYQNQQNITVADLKKYAEEIDLDPVTFTSCLDSGKYEMELKKDMADGFDVGVRGTPTWFINGYKFEGSLPSEIFKEVIDFYLSH